jgi:hypothetical protein
MLTSCLLSTTCQEYELKAELKAGRGHGKVELKISREYRELAEREGKAKMPNKKPNMGLSARQAMEDVQAMLRRLFIRRRLQQFIAMKVRKRKLLATLQGTANYLQV